ncbi:MAG TPA: TMEM175 family protein [Thermomicrobiales bacterium]|nr:TMEM175 family protein [Thermomicrobiales bacterium]
MKTTRLEAFSDGVFAIAITLLIIEVKVPEVESGALWHALRDQWSSYAGFVVSFLVIGVIWVNHHTMFDTIVKADEKLLFLNLILLMVVAFIPFPTALLAHYLEAGHDAHVAAYVYSATMLAMGLAYTAVWAYAMRTKGIVTDRLDSRARRVLLNRSLLGCVIYAVSFGAAAIGAELALAFHAVVALLFVLSPRPQVAEEGLAG